MTDTIIPGRIARVDVVDDGRSEAQRFRESGVVLYGDGCWGLNEDSRPWQHDVARLYRHRLAGVDLCALPRL